MGVLSGKVALVTGSSRGIGRAIATAFAEEGADVVVNYLRRDDLAQEVVREIESLGVRSFAVKADVSDPLQVEKMAAEVERRFGRLDVLVNNAGMLLKSPLEEVSVEDWNKVVAVNLNGVFYTMRAFAGLMIRNRGGSIINVASVAGYVPLILGGAYSASKAGVIMLTKQAAVEWGRYGIRVNAICPGPVETEMLRSEYTEEQLKIRKEIMPIRRLGRPEDVAKLAVFLASDESRYVTGEAYGIDGGMAVSTYWLINQLVSGKSNRC